MWTGIADGIERGSRRPREGSAGAPRVGAYGTLGGIVPEPRDPTERSELLKQLRIDRDTARAPRSRARPFALGASIVLALAVLVWFGVARLPPPAVRTAVARAAGEAGAGSVLDASGYVTARRQATVSAKITGKIVEALLSLAEAQLTAARSQLAEIRAQLEQAERDYVRQRQLFDKQLVAEQTLDAARAQRDTLRARLA